MSERFDTFAPQPGRQVDWGAVEPEDDDDDELDPRAAAALLEQTTRQAERRFDNQPTWYIVTAAVVVLVAYGAAWLSVRHQHPYLGPSGTALATLYGTLVVWAIVVTLVQRRALEGRSSRQRRLEALVFAPVWICVYIFQGALYHAGHSHAIAYGIYPAVAPLLIVGAAGAGYEAGRGNRGRAGFCVAAVVLAAVAAFAGPRNVWAVAGIGLCVLLLLAAAARAWRR